MGRRYNIAEHLFILFPILLGIIFCPQHLGPFAVDPFGVGQNGSQWSPLSTKPSDLKKAKPVWPTADGLDCKRIGQL